jgi:hypothetical protein
MQAVTSALTLLEVLVVPPSRRRQRTRRALRTAPDSQSRAPRGRPGSNPAACGRSAPRSPREAPDTRRPADGGCPECPMRRARDERSGTPGGCRPSSATALWRSLASSRVVRHTPGLHLGDGASPRAGLQFPDARAFAESTLLKWELPSGSPGPSFSFDGDHSEPRDELPPPPRGESSPARVPQCPPSLFTS